MGELDRPNHSDRQATRAICYKSFMSKTPYPSAQSFPVSTNATTFGPQAVSVIPPSPSYRSITAVVVAERENGKLLGLWRPGSRQREVSGVQHDDSPNAFLPPFVRSATIP